MSKKRKKGRRPGNLVEAALGVTQALNQAPAPKITWRELPDAQTTAEIVRATVTELRAQEKQEKAEADREYALRHLEWLRARIRQSTLSVEEARAALEHPENVGILPMRDESRGPLTRLRDWLRRVG